MKNVGIYLLIAAAGLARLIPHPFNVTPVGGLALFSGAYVNDRRALLIPVGALVLGDLLLGFYAAVVMAGVYAGFIVSVLISRWILLERVTLSRYIIAVLVAAIAFYLISNIGMWYYLWPHTLTGFIACLVEGLPFLARSILGDFIYSGIMFASMHYFVSTAQPDPA